MNMAAWWPLNWWKQSSWQEIDGAAYECAYAQFGGSVITHPQFIAAVSSLTAMPLRYFGRFEGESLIGAVPTWHSFIAGDKRALKRAKQYEKVDLGNMEVILPFASPTTAIPLHFKSNYLCAMHAAHIQPIHKQLETLSMLKSYSGNEFSKKFQYNRNREWSLLEKAGGVVRDMNEFSLPDIFKWYVELFELRWQKKPKAYATLYEQLNALKNFLTGKILFLHDKPIAMQILFMAHSPEWISVEFLNGGVDPEFYRYSSGSVLTSLNTQWVSNYAQSQGKQLRYSFGLSDADYKSLWCYQVPFYRT
jgi:hypothetical protein